MRKWERRWWSRRREAIPRLSSFISILKSVNKNHREPNGCENNAEFMTSGKIMNIGWRMLWKLTAGRVTAPRYKSIQTWCAREDIYGGHPRPGSLSVTLAHRPHTVRHTVTAQYCDIQERYLEFCWTGRQVWNHQPQSPWTFYFISSSLGKSNNNNKGGEKIKNIKSVSSIGHWCCCTNLFVGLANYCDRSDQ